ncbi:MAG: tetratricopeptide repeat protein [Bacteriovoracaceae bacterium]|jgi:hypothetical protein|nr:tetratricopeptide repeat protein [Bacteriovoracaceae bacterium]
MSDNVKDQVVTKLNQFIENKDYSAAKEYLNSLELSDVAQWYNLGYLAYKKGDLVTARAYLEKAKYEGMFSDEMGQALGLVKNELGLQYIEQDHSFQDNLMLNMVSFSSEFYLAFFAMFLSFVLIFIWKRIYLLGVLFGVLVLMAGSGFYIKKNYSIVFNQNESVVYSGPSRIFEEQQILPKGIKFIVGKKSGDWKYVIYPQSYRGWIYKNKAISL